MIHLQSEALSAKRMQEHLHVHGNGAIVTFDGIVRSPSQGKEVLHLEFEAYEPMAISEMEKIRAHCKREFEITELIMHHRMGKVGVGESAVVVLVVAPHRNAAFSACAQAMDLLKERVPIWKKEVFADGEVWVSAHP